MTLTDEIFGGYPWYHNRDILFEETFPWSRSLDTRLSVIKKGLLKNPEDYVSSHCEDTVARADVLPSDSILDRRMRRMFMLNIEWFMQTLLERKDKMSMESGLEVRVPFCDHRIVEYSYNMPWIYKSLNGREKGIVREAVKDMLPADIVERKKSPYPKTHHPEFMRLVTEAAYRVRDDKNSPAAGLIDWGVVKEIIENPGSLKSPWYGQLMGVPQILAYIIQVDAWLRGLGLQIEGV